MNNFKFLVFVLLTILTSACGTLQVHEPLPEFTLPSTFAVFNDGIGEQTGLGGCTRNGRGLCVRYVANKIPVRDLHDPELIFLGCAYDVMSGSKIVIGSANGCIQLHGKASAVFIDNIPPNGQVTVSLEQVISLSEPPVTLARGTCTKNKPQAKTFSACDD